MLLHTCCAICAIPILINLKSKNITPHLYFFNPNIFPKEEYQRRKSALQKLAQIFQLKVIEENYDHKAWKDFIIKALPQPPENYPENKERCNLCFKFRLSHTAYFAKKNNFSIFATTLSLSRFKDVKFINTFGQSLAENLGLQYWSFPQETPIQHYQSIQFAKQYNLYRQKYCGCEYSLPPRQKQIFKVALQERVKK